MFKRTTVMILSGEKGIKEGRKEEKEEEVKTRRRSEQIKDDNR